MSLQLDWWAGLNHGGLLIAPNKVQEYFRQELDPIPYGKAERLRREITRFDGTSESLSPLLDFLLEDLCHLPAAEWQKAQHIDSKWSLSSFTKEQIKPRRIWVGPNGETLPVFVPQAGSSKTIGNRLGVGKSRKLLSRVLEWLRRQQQPLALITNGRQLRLVHAGQDYDAWCEWDIDLWFAEGAPSAQVTAWRQLLDRSVLLTTGKEAPGTLLSAILDSRKGQAELSSVLGERVRLAVEELITASHSSIETAREQGVLFDYRDLYMAGTRIIMRCIIALFAEARGLLPVDNRIYQHSYSIDGLRQQLDRRASGRGGERLAQGRSAWPRVVALFNLIYHGSSHEALPVPQYSGNLFMPGNAANDDSLTRALALLEAPTNPVSDKQVRQILRLLTRTKVQVRQGRRSTWVDGPVDFAALSTEYIGILYEGLLDFELKRAEDSDPIIFLREGRQPALPLSRLEGMDDKAIKQLFEELKKKDSGPGSEDEGDGDDESAEEEDQTEDQDLDGADSEQEPADDTIDVESEVTVGDEIEIAISATDLERAQSWLERAAEVAGLVKRPRGRAAGAEGAYEQARRAAGKQLCARLIAPGQFYLVRWGGTRKGAGTFYTRPQLAAPTVSRTLQPLAFEPVRTEIDVRTGLEEVVEWVPRKPEVILSLKVCDPTMGSGSFPVSALRFLTDALVQSLYHYHRIDRTDTGAVARLADGHELTKDTEQPIPVLPDHEAFEDMLRVQLKRHVVERCIYGADIDPLAVELGRMALWVETMDRTLPFGFLDHKLKVGNTLLGTWFDTFREYPAMAWEREGGDKDYQKDKPDRLINHYYVDLKGKKRGDVFTVAIKERKSEIQQQLIIRLSGQLSLDEDVTAVGIHEELTRVFEDLHTLPVHETEKRALLYQEKVLNNPRYHTLKERMDLWCALWFWPGSCIDKAPTPDTFVIPSSEALTIARQVAREQKFFHWELEFPDVFTPERKGFDAKLGNPPWETMQPNSKEFFSNIDPLYRAYGKQEALLKQLEYFKESPEIEQHWIEFNAGFKAFANWMNNVGKAFGNGINEDNDGKRKHDINLGGRGKESFASSERLHNKWLTKRLGYTNFSDSRHPFIHQGKGKPYLQKMFLEQSHALLRDGGRLGMIVPSGVYTDKGTTGLRQLFLNQCDWQWLFGFENREGIFDIHRSFKFCSLVVQKGSVTAAIRASFMHRDVDDWNQAERHVLAYPRKRVEEFSPCSNALLEIRSEKDLLVLQKIYTHGVLFGDKSDQGWNIKYQQGDFNMTSDSSLFPERSKWESKGYQSDEYGHWLKGLWQDFKDSVHILDRQSGLILSRDRDQAIHVDHVDDVALPLYQGVMIRIFDWNAARHISGAGNRAAWEIQNFERRYFQPQFLMGINDCINSLFGSNGRLLFRDLSNPTNARTLITAFAPSFPSGNKSPILTSDKGLIGDLALTAVLGSYSLDYVLRIKFATSAGASSINPFILNELSLTRPKCISTLALWAARLSLSSEIFAPQWVVIKQNFSEKSWRSLFALSYQERLRCKAVIEALVAKEYGLEMHELKVILSECDYPVQVIGSNAFSRQLNPKGFWRVDKEKEPELRHTVLSLIAFHDLQEKGLDAFISQNDGEGWMIPEALRIADYGLGHDDRAHEYQPVASRLGPRFYDWQLNEDVKRSWEECEAHAELIRKIVPIQAPDDEGSVDAPTSPAAPSSQQMNLF